MLRKRIEKRIFSHLDLKLELLSSHAVKNKLFLPCNTHCFETSTNPALKNHIKRGPTQSKLSQFYTGPT